MANVPSFEELLHQDIRWPQPGDNPFSVPEGSRNHARIDEHGFSRFVLMTEGYKQAAERLVDAAVQIDGDRDILVYPVLFLYRHCLELELKYFISTYGPSVNVAPIWNSHNLVALWQAFERVLEGYGVKGEDSADPVVGGIVAEFAKIDPQSFSYRYPCDTKGNVIPVDQNALHLETLKDVMDGVFGYFTGCDGYLDHLHSAVPY